MRREKETLDRRAKSGVHFNVCPFKQRRIPNSREKMKREIAPDRRGKSGACFNNSPFKQSDGVCHKRTREVNEAEELDPPLEER